MAKSPNAAKQPAVAGRLKWGLFDQRIGPAVRLLRNELTVRINEAYAPFDLHQGAMSAMVLIDANPGCSQSDLARELAMDKSVLVAIVDQLEARGLARRIRSTIDRRRNTLELTDAGIATMAQINECARRVEQPMRAALNAEERAQLTSLLKRAYAALLAEG